MEWKCGKCGATAISKCPWERNVFIQDRNVALLGATTIAVVKPGRAPAIQEVTLRMDVHAPAATKGEAIALAIQNLADITAQEWEKATCKHDWLLANGEQVCRLGHEHGKYPEPVACNEPLTGGQ